jgi:hypothetical protein
MASNFTLRPDVSFRRKAEVPNVLLMTRPWIKVSGLASGFELRGSSPELVLCTRRV